MQGLTITTDEQDGVTVATLVGDIDLVNHAAAAESLLGTAMASGPRLVLDMQGVGYVDSNGVRMLFELAEELSHSRIEWNIALGERSPLARLFKVTAFDEVARVYASATDAVDALKERS